MLKNCVKSILFVIVLLTTQVNAATCPTPSFDAQTANVTIPCLVIGNNRWEVNLNYSLPPFGAPAEGMYWKLGQVMPATCDWSPTSCAVADQNWDLTLPLTGVITDTKHIGKLKQM